MMNETLCKQKYQHFENDRSYCNVVFDGTLCWGPTIAGNSTYQNCPAKKGFSTKSFAWRSCTENGTWFNNNRTELIEKGFTNYSGCLKPIVLELYQMCKKVGMDKCMEIIGVTRNIEMVGLSLSLVSLIISLFIFYRYRILRNNRTKIHKNLFIATALQVVVRLIIYVDQRFEQVSSSFIEEVSHLCETFQVLLEFCKTATIMWMFIEGLYLHNAITVTVFQEHSYIKLYCYTGWIVPQVLTAIWIITMIHTETDQCWYLYNFLPAYWILEGPRSILIVVNMIFLLNIIRILIMKLRQSEMGEIEQVRKAVRAAVFLVPLMGTSNILFLKDFRHFKDAWKFASWSYTTYFLISFQGLFLSTLYCFLNGEVRDAIKNSLSLYMSLRYNKTQVRGLSTTEEQA